MDAYVYQAALLCSDCAKNVTADGPYGAGGGEADFPQHCDQCGAFLENPLTPDGILYVRDAIDDDLFRINKSPTIQLWKEFYGLGR